MGFKYMHLLCYISQHVTGHIIALGARAFDPWLKSWSVEIETERAWNTELTE